MRIYLLFLFFVIGSLSAQKSTCKSPKEESFDDFNSIVAKCTVVSTKNKANKSKQLTVRVSAPKIRFFKKRNKKAVKKRIKKSNRKALAVDPLNHSEISEVSTKNETSSELVKANDLLVIPQNIKLEEISKEELLSANKFSTVDRLPSFKNCKSNRKRKQLNCFNDEMINHIQKFFKYPAFAVRNHLKGEVWVRFIIDKKGYVKNIKALGPDNCEVLNNEAIRVVLKLPRFTPAKVNGKNVAVKYGFPVNFSLEE